MITSLILASKHTYSNQSAFLSLVLYSFRVKNSIVWIFLLSDYLESSSWVNCFSTFSNASSSAFYVVISYPRAPNIEFFLCCSL